MSIFQNLLFEMLSREVYLKIEINTFNYICSIFDWMNIFLYTPKQTNNRFGAQSAALIGCTDEDSQLRL